MGSDALNYQFQDKQLLRLQRTIVFAAVAQGLLTSGTNRGNFTLDIRDFSRKVLEAINQ